jgi:hypothetical protein
MRDSGKKLIYSMSCTCFAPREVAGTYTETFVVFVTSVVIEEVTCTNHLASFRAFRLLTPELDVIFRASS